MSLMKWAFIGLLLLPVVELAAFVLVALTIGWMAAAVLFVATSVIGIVVLKRSGRAHLSRLREAVANGGVAAVRVDSPSLGVMVGGILLVFPGFVTDLVGALLFIPQLRRWASARIGRALKASPTRRNASAIDLAPEEWRQVAERQVEHDRDGEQDRRRKRRDGES